jgi:hypothetical protein
MCSGCIMHSSSPSHRQSALDTAVRTTKIMVRCSGVGIVEGTTFVMAAAAATSSAAGLALISELTALGHVTIFCFIL